MYSDWDQKNEILRSPEDRDSLSAWLTDANDDAGNARPAFIASKNVFFPDQKEIDSLELYISKYLWGGMQMTDKEKYPYAIYGIPNFKANRASADAGRNGQAHVWRIYDYPHIVMLYYRMYHIAKFYPAMVKHLDAPTYLERAYRTAVAYWTVPMAVEKWSADAVGTMNEAFIPELIDTLEQEGKQEWADTLRGHWEGKVERFVMKTPNLYGSEFAFDSTGFESTGAFAKYAVTRGTPKRSAPRCRPMRRAASMDFQLLLNMSDRGWLEPTYYQLGSDYRGNLSYLLSYMSQMGGWSILDYGLHFAADPTDYLRLGYASRRSAPGRWSTPAPRRAATATGSRRKNNDGATGGGFMPEPIGRAWIGKQMTRGAWHYSAEEDVGYAGALRTQRDDRHARSGLRRVRLRRRADARTRPVSVIPRDGLRVRFHVVRDEQRLHMELDHDGFAKEQPVVVSDASTACSSRSRTAPAARTRPGSGSPVCPRATTPCRWTDVRPGSWPGRRARDKVAIAVGAAPSTRSASRACVRGVAEGAHDSYVYRRVDGRPVRVTARPAPRGPVLGNHYGRCRQAGTRHPLESLRHLLRRDLATPAKAACTPS